MYMYNYVYIVCKADTNRDYSWTRVGVEVNRYSSMKPNQPRSLPTSIGVHNHNNKDYKPKPIAN